MRYRHILIRNTRLEHGLTLTELARKTRLSNTTLTFVEQGKAPWLKAIRAIAKALDLSLADVIIAETEEIPPQGRRSA